jgi:hypothetical protein
MDNKPTTINQNHGKLWAAHHNSSRALAASISCYLIIKQNRASNHNSIQQCFTWISGQMFKDFQILQQGFHVASMYSSSICIMADSITAW